MNRQVGRCWCFIRVRYACKLTDFASEGTGIQAFNVAADALIKGAINKHLKKVGNALLELGATAAVGRNQGRDRDDIMLGQEFGNKPDAQHIGVAIGTAKAKVFAEMLTNLVAVEQFPACSLGRQSLGNGCRQGRFTRTRQSGEPKYTAHENLATTVFYSRRYWQRLWGPLYPGNVSIATSAKPLRFSVGVGNTEAGQNTLRPWGMQVQVRGV